MKGMAWTLDQLKDKTNLLATISIDGATAEIFYANATGMIDLEVTIEGPGGHAWTACERVSAIHTAGLAIAEIAKIVPPKDPKTTLTVSLIEGGQAIHAIAQKAVFKINARSNSQAALNEIEEQIYHAIRRGVEIEQKKEGGEGETQSFDRKDAGRPRRISGRMMQRSFSLPNWPLKPSAEITNSCRAAAPIPTCLSSAASLP